MLPREKKINKSPGIGAASPPDPPAPVMTFAKAFHDFGTVRKGAKVSTVFSFKNTGNKDLIIELVSGCHCSILEWPEGQTFKPGEGGEIKVTFDSMREEQYGEMNKTVDILLEHTNPDGYQVIEEVKYRVVLEQ